MMSFRDFVDDALFAPGWGHYSSGRIRFGEGGHYDTFPLALSPVFGRMVAELAFRFWERAGRPHGFELCELGAGNGQLCLDTLLAVDAARSRRAFAAALRYRIVERSRALVARQQAQLGVLATRVSWTRADLSRGVVRDAARGSVGLVIGNEVLDCLAHHKIVRARNGEPRVVFVRVLHRGRPVGRRALGALLARGAHVVVREVGLPLAAVRGLGSFVTRFVPEVTLGRRAWPPYFACPEMVTLVRNVGRLYQTAEMLWIDYGDSRAFHRRTPERRCVFAGPPRSGRGVYDAPGADDITFMVDFSVVARAAIEAGLTVAWYGGQAGLAAASGVPLDRAAVDEIVRYRVLGWALNALGVGPERAWRRRALTWDRRAGRGGRLADGVARDAAEFLGRRRSHFKLLVLHTPAAAARRGPSPWTDVAQERSAIVTAAPPADGSASR